jgi:plasmid stabilization system protein ParE
LKRGLLLTAAARQDLVGVVRDIAQDKKYAVNRVAPRVDQAASALAVRATGRPGRVDGTCEKTLGRLADILACKIVISADGGETIAILRVIYSARNWPAGQWPAGGV